MSSPEPTSQPKKAKYPFEVTVYDGVKARNVVLTSTDVETMKKEAGVDSILQIYVASPRPRTPEPPPLDLVPFPLRYPETLGNVIVIGESEGKGLGVFAAKDIPGGTLLLNEAPLISFIDNGARADPLNVLVDALPPEQRKSFRSLHAYRQKNLSLNRCIVYSNGYSIHDDLGSGVFETASRINHSCVPNAHYKWCPLTGPNGEKEGRMMFWSRWKLLKGQEITASYGHKRRNLKKIYGFDCDCGECWDNMSDAISLSSSEGGEQGGEMPNIDGLVGSKIEEKAGSKIEGIEEELGKLVL